MVSGEYDIRADDNANRKDEWIGYEDILNATWSSCNELGFAIESFLKLFCKIVPAGTVKNDAIPKIEDDQSVLEDDHVHCAEIG